MNINVIKFPHWGNLCEVTAIGRTAYWPETFLELLKKDTKDAEYFLEKIIKLEHESVLEHLYYTFNISEISRWATHQLVRHRIGSFTQKSLRQVREISLDDFVINLNLGDEEISKAKVFFDNCVQEYYAAIERGLGPDDARMYLSGNIMTEITWTVNLRALRNFLSLRSKPEALWEMRLLSQLIAKTFVQTGMGFLLKDIMELPEARIEN